MKEALGLAVSGAEVRLAYLVSDKGGIRIENLERAKLRSSLEAHHSTSPAAETQNPDNPDAFGLRNGAGDKNTRAEDFPREDTANLEVLFGLLDKFTKKKIKVAFNVPLSMASYQQHGPVQAGATIVERLGGADKEATLNLALHQFKSAEGIAPLNMFYEQHPSSMTLLQAMKGFTRNNLMLGQMQTTELALVNLARAGMELEEDKVTAVIHLEEDFSRLIFLRGRDLLHVSSLINERASSPDVLEVIYRRLIYEQDEAQIPELRAIMLTGIGSRMRAKEFFARHCTGVKVSYLSTTKLGAFPSTEVQRAVFSEFAVAIGLAWKLLEPKNAAFMPLDLLPQEIKDEQEVLKLGMPGYVLLGLTGLIAFFFTWQILSLRNDINGLRSKNSQLELQIKNNQSTVDKVHALENECKRLSKNLMLSDSLSHGYDDFLSFTQKLNKSVRRTGGVWVEEILKQKSGFSIKGSSLQRDKIPLLAEQLEHASLRQVTRAENGRQKIFKFELERQQAQSKFEFSAGGIRIIDPNSSRASGNLILGKENAAPGTGISTTPPRNENLKPANTNEPRQPRQTPEESSRTTPRANGMIKEASTPLPTSEQNQVLEQNKTASAKPSTATTARTAVAEQKISPAALNNNASQSPNRQMAAREPGKIDDAATSKAQSGGANATDAVAPALASTASASTASAPASASGFQMPAANYRWYSIEAISSPREDHMEELKNAYVRQGYQAALGTYYDAKEQQKLYRVLIGLFKTSAAAEKQAKEMGTLLHKGYRIVGLD